MFENISFILGCHRVTLPQKKKKKKKKKHLSFYAEKIAL